MSVDISAFTKASANGTTSAVCAHPADLTANAGGADDELIMLAHYGNSEGADPTHNGTGWTDLGDIYDGAQVVFTVTNKALTSNVATLTTSAVHGFAVGISVVVAGVDATFNGTFTVASVPTTTTFTYAKTASNVTSQAATGTVTSDWGSLGGLRGVKAWYKVSDGSETDGTGASASNITVTNNGTSNTGKAIRVVIARWARDPLTSISWATPVARFDQDTSLGTALNIIAATDPGGGNGDVLLGSACWVPLNNHTGGNSTVLDWPGTTGSAQILDTASYAGGNQLRANSYWRGVSGGSTGAPSLNLTLASPGGAGVGVLIRLRTTGTPLIADAGASVTGQEPGLPFTDDGSRSQGSLTAWDWEGFDTGAWVDLPGSGAIRTETAPHQVAGVQLQRRLRVTDGSTFSSYDTVTVDVLAPTEFCFIGGVRKSLKVMWLT